MSSFRRLTGIDALGSTALMFGLLAFIFQMFLMCTFFLSYPLAALGFLAAVGWLAFSNDRSAWQFTGAVAGAALSLLVLGGLFSAELAMLPGKLFAYLLDVFPK